MHLIVIDLIPALLSWEGRDASDPPLVADQAETVLETLFQRFRLAAVADSDRPATEIREVLERAALGGFFESVGTAAGMGPHVSPRVIRRIAVAIRATPERVIVATGRTELAKSLEKARIATVTVAPGELEGLLEQLRRLTRGRPNP